MAEIKSIIAFCGGVIGFLFGAIDGLFTALVAFVVLDYITGVIAAIVKHELSSEIGFKGIVKKIAIFIVVAIANIIDQRCIQQGAILRTTAIFFYLSNDGISILENIIEMGVPVPQVIKDKLLQLKERDNERKEDIW